MEDIVSTDGRSQLRSWIEDSVTSNESLLYERAQTTYTQLVGLFNESTNVMGAFSHESPSLAGYGPTARALFVLNTLSPISSGILSSCLMGNLHGCFMMLRLLLETLALCWHADRECDATMQFEQRMQYIEDSHARLTDVLSELDAVIEAAGSASILWKKLSREWLHPRMYGKKLISAVESTGMAPSWALMIPNSFGLEDLNDIKELGQTIEEFRNIMLKIIAHWSAFAMGKDE